MKKGVICLLVLILFLLSSTVFAANWVYVLKDNDPILGSDYKSYVDSDTIIKNGNNIIYWELCIYDKISLLGSKKELRKHETIMSNPRQERVLKICGYDANDQEIYNIGNKPVGEFSEVYPSSISDKLIDFALQYAKEGQNTNQIPDISQVPQN